MNWAYLSVLAVGVMPVVCTAIAKAGAKHYDNHDVRTWLARQPTIQNVIENLRQSPAAANLEQPHRMSQPSSAYVSNALMFR